MLLALLKNFGKRVQSKIDEFLFGHSPNLQQMKSVNFDLYGQSLSDAEAVALEDRVAASPNDFYSFCGAVQLNRLKFSADMNIKCLSLLFFCQTLNASICALTCLSAEGPQVEQALQKASKGDYEGAVALLKSSGDKSAWTVPTKIKAARIYEQVGQLESANQLLDQVTGIAGKVDAGSLSLAWRYKGDCARDASKFDEAESFFERSGKVSPTEEMRILSFRAAARIRRQQNRFTDCLNLLDKGAPSGTDNVWWHYEKACALVELKKFSQASEDLSFIIKVAKTRQQKSGDSNVHLLTLAYTLRIKCYEQMHMSKEESENRKALKAIDQSWAEDLLGPDNIR